MTQPEIVREPGLMQQRLIAQKRAGKTVAVVPTMGALHAGHRRLIAEGRKRGDILVVTVFVNPTQFGPNEDLDKYPRTFDSDLEICREEGVDFLFFPTDALMYPQGYATYVETREMGKRLCGISRPTHFCGVTTVVSKLFLITQADVAVFGWKDAQQLLILKRMAQDLNFPVEIVGVETVREPDGLALSSRNHYLSPQQRSEAVVLSKALGEIQRRYQEEHETDSALLRQEAFDRIARDSSGRVDYLEVVSMETLEPVGRIVPGKTLVALAVYFGTTRLIDNIRL
ncbi:MAG TPA: pantoate--beta-alanine ligase [Candidatus Sumerlaeota bacterium]|nr:pantoate--beta-alanine ligase [Candidatus Sumerlaeota bacterium]